MKNEERLFNKIMSLGLNRGEVRKIVTRMPMSTASVFGEVVDTRSKHILWMNNLETDQKYKGTLYHQ